MKTAIFLIQIIVAVLVIGVIMLQQKGTGLGSTFGGELSFYRTRRGAEKMIFYLTIGLVCLFIALSIIGLVV
ncbi:preprotein translocase subunit SecG [Candidatus Daviesbacteria bacterium RIFCSPLOWO2_01_FULL_39_12]|uniref:Protein-export membrane protein SecG n=1 Tax=Candidatus Daviesbacteria bacterium RIFCSPLOWO2_01_FULL_39_12 TaxID=1797785 RepID=A0A1F5KSX4_9BACT|nr:MAG: preprotein translocase subunit SecG [Candidatus Daviesbacteria bacterium RIFCSPHIGHO2_02_FULL_39_8]OGE44023.1 MAG: preprotein translocase subunit SecG [Candidatus Daviesbacteria bacterium RIFCSPLOWO2_01_FULL_39_12]